MTADTEFLEALEAARRLRPPGHAPVLIFAIAGFVTIMLIWAALAEIEQVTRASGRVVPSQSVQVVQSLEGGLLEALLVAEGDIVTAGQLLARLSDVVAGAEARGGAARLDGLRAAEARLVAEADGAAPVFPEDLDAGLVADERALYQARQSELREAIAVLQQRQAELVEARAEAEARITQASRNITLTKRELAITAELVEEGVVSELEKLRLEQSLNSQEGEFAAATAARARLVEEAGGIEARIAQERAGFRARALGELNEKRIEIAALSEGQMARTDRLDRTQLRSPVNGIVQSIAQKTIGGVVQPGQRLIEIVPLEDELKITARVRPSDVAFLHPGQPVRVKVTAYDYQRYGWLEGELTRISADAVTDPDGTTFFEVDLRTERAWLGSAEDPLPISPGMVADIDVLTGERTVLDYLIRPLNRLKDNALREG